VGAGNSTEEGQERSGALKLHLDSGNVVSWAMEQNGIPLIHSIQVFNDSDYDIEELAIHVELSPDALREPYIIEIPRLASGQTLNFDTVDLRLSSESLHSLIEKRQSRLSLDIFDSQKQRLARAEKSISVLACNQWSLHSSLPELIAAFVLPNAQAIQSALKAARDLLKEETGDPSFSGYQSKSPVRVRQMIDAVYRSLQRLDITYLSPPANFESDGQKVRFPDQLLRYRMGTCLDLTVFLAACLEQIGLNPILVLEKGHAYPGCWLVDDRFHIAVEEDAQSLRKMAEADQILFFDSSTVTVRPPLPLKNAIDVANENLLDESRFLFAVDLGSARLAKILPLPIQSVRTAEPVEEEVFAEVAEVDGGFDTGKDLPTQAKESEWSRVKTWKDKLLDLSLRNRLLNFQLGSKSVVPLDIPDSSAFEDELAANKSYLIEAKIEIDSNDPRNADLLGGRGAQELYESERNERFERGRLLSKLTRAELAKRIKHIYRTARSNLQETGANTLYIGLGILEWYESEKAEKLRRAPIILIPVQLIRKRAGLAWRLSISDDETRINSTLLEKLKSDFSLDFAELREMPVDDSGVDVKAIFRTIRRGIVRIPRWELKDQCSLAILSFTKHLMWLDLDNKMEALLENELVRHLVNPAESKVFESAQFFDPATLDEDVPPLNSHLVLGADSSQQSAIMSAANGCHFVLQGPPGTGKSQTIANIIAHFLSQGQSVLFVSEKMAALDVVYKRLKKVGLGDFCLELHSNKANKRKVCLSLAKTLDYESPEISTQVNEVATSIARRRRQLNDYVQALHHSYPIGFSLYSALGRLSEFEGRVQLLEDFDLGDVLSISEAQYKSQKSQLKELSDASLDIDKLDHHPLTAVHFSDWSPLKAKQLRAHLGGLIEGARQLAEKMSAFRECAPALADESRYDYLALIPRVCSLIAQSPRPSMKLLTTQPRTGFELRLKAVRGLHEQRQKLEKELFSIWENTLLRLDLNSLISSFRQYNEANFISRWFNLRGPKNELYAVVKSGHLPPNESILKDLINARSCIELDRKIDPHIAEIQHFLGEFYKGDLTDWAAIYQLFDWVDQYHEMLGQLDLHSSREIQRESLYQFACEPKAAQLSQLKLLSAPLEAQLGSFSEGIESLFKSLDIDVESLLGQSWQKTPLEEICEQLTKIRENWDGLRNWSRLQERVKKAREAELCPQFLQALLSGQIAPDQIIESFERSVLDRFVQLVVDSNRLLSSFEGRAQNRAVVDFIDKDDRFIDMGGSRISRQLSKSLPKKSNNVSASSEVGLLLREAKKKVRHKAIRKLLSEIPNLLPRLKPCFLMSPLSIAQYLPAEGNKFDLVIFDEASQIPTHDAIGAIARGKQVVVVGDSKQLPPTQFFTVTSKQEEENPDDTSRMSELESILDECIASQVPSMMLKWHYRSRSEELITFSNQHYYDNKLNTFPAPLAKAQDFGLSFNYLKDAVYDKGVTRTNLVEARSCVDWVVNTLKDPVKRSRSIGIVTFSIAQQGLIEDMLELERAKHIEIEDYFSDRAPEPLFVKNLENVQGDERDVILFSLCYGPDEAGKLSMNFGPLNREGGERRLNVAITRAREQLIVFSSLQAEHIDLSRTRARGAAHLKAFLRYARGGASASMAGAKSERSLKAVRLEEALALHLMEKGYQVDRQVGCSNYRVDLAVTDPDNEGQYLLAIEGDGHNYAFAETAADRDRIRGSVLESLGWQRKRFWSLDWLYQKDKSKAFEQIEQVLERVRGEERRGLSFLLSNGVIEPLEISEEEELELEIPPDEYLAEAFPVTVGDISKREDNLEKTAAEISKAKDAAQEAVDLEEETEKVAVSHGLAQPYSAYEMTTAPRAQADFFSPAYTEELRILMAAIIELEAPIHVKELTNRLAPAWNISRQTSKVKKRIKTVLKHPLLKNHFVQRDEFLWRSQDDPESWSRVRDFRSDDSKRKFRMICPEEVMAAAAAVLERDISLSRSQLIKETAKLLGFGRIGKKSQTAVAVLIDQLIEGGRAKETAGSITVI
jgi:very-short-patch-repair endonuclease